MSLKSETLKQGFTTAQTQLPRDLGHGLVVRTATPADTESLAQLVGRVFGRGTFSEHAAAYARDLMRESHPIIGPADALIVEDNNAKKIVSTMCLIPQTWTYAGIPFGVGRPEMVATDPDYRRRGMVREQFQAIHAMSDSMGHLVQGITGIPWYYRQFGYEYALDLGGGRLSYFSNVPALKENEHEPYRFREITIDDIPFVSSLYDRESSRSLVACPRTESLWRYLLDDSPAPRTWRVPMQLIETNEGRAVGYFAPSHEIWNEMIVVEELATSEEQSMRAVLPAILRWMKTYSEALAAKEKKTVKGIHLAFGREHPAYDAAPDLLPGTRPSYGWYIRVPDVPRFIGHIAPALEARLARSAVAGYSGELRISEYRRGFKLVFENGKLVDSETWQPTVEDGGDCGFPPHVFLRMLFGEKSLAELRAFYPDCSAKDDAAVVLDALFPKIPSCVHAID